ncbi:MAG: hypothetical protein KC736_04630 [Candidatus Moranbacteria bacterium]|nr:hypothetical protein [Candidatus Moranbacteria bacterium]
MSRWNSKGQPMGGVSLHAQKRLINNPNHGFIGSRGEARVCLQGLKQVARKKGYEDGFVTVEELGEEVLSTMGRYWREEGYLKKLILVMENGGVKTVMLQRELLHKYYV